MSTPITWSHSGLKDFEGCARRYHEVKVLKKFPHKDTKHTIYGKEVHKAIELYGRDGVPMPPALADFKPAVDAILAKPGRKLFEHEMGVTADLRPCAFDAPDRWVRGIADLLIVNDDNLTARCVDWKGLALDTPIPTPQGWATMGSLQVGDLVFDAQGKPTRVVGKSQVKHIPCYKITFSDTTTVVCDEEHLWKLASGRVVGVRDLTGKRNKKQRVKPPRIAVAAPLALPDIPLPIDPYVLGLWLADGKRASSEISKPDLFVWEEVQRRGYAVNMETGGSKSCPTRTVKGLRTQLVSCGLLGANKRIPPAYLRAGYSQRLDLLRGLMDGDGNANPTRKQAVYTTTSKELSNDVCELLSSLGQRPLQSTVTARGFNTTTTAYPVSFRPIGINPFLLPRKAERIDARWGAGDSATRIVVSVEQVPTVPTQCIAVESEDHTFLCTERMVPTHNTGNDKYPDRDQLVLMSLMVFTHFPHIRRVSSALMFVVKGSMFKHRMERDEAEETWWRYRERVAKLEAAHANNVWNPSQSPLCGWCPVKSCVFHPDH
jgi:hypothetical protein